MPLDAPITVTDLAVCFGRVRQGSDAPGLDKVDPRAYEANLQPRLEDLSRRLNDRSWRPDRLLRLRHPKPTGGTRLISIPTVGDRVVIEWLRDRIAPRVESALSPAAFAYRTGRGPRPAMDALEYASRHGAPWIVLTDIRDFFDTIPLRHVLQELMRVLKLERSSLLLHTAEQLLLGQATRGARGLPQGSALSPSLSNLALHAADARLLHQGFELIRYCDNLCVPARAEAQGRDALSAIRREMERLGMALKPTKTSVTHVDKGVSWLGFSLGPEGRRVSHAAVDALRARVDRAMAEVHPGQADLVLRPIVRGWVQYFDAPLPPDVGLGRHETLVQSLIAELRTAPPAPLADPDPLAEDAWRDGAEAEDEDDAEPHARTDQQSWLDEAERLVLAGRFAEAEDAWELAHTPVPVTDEPAPEAEAASWDEEQLDLMLGLLCAAQHRFEALGKHPIGRRDFERFESPPSPADLRAHLRGERPLAILPRLPDGTCTIGVIDVDAGPTADPTAAEAFARALATVAHARGLTTLIERTGGRGAHLWVPVAEPIPADHMASTLHDLVAATGTPARGVQIELLPGGSGAPDLHGQAITLPLGRHRDTGAPSTLAWSFGPSVQADLVGLTAADPNPPERFAPPAPPPGTAATPVNGPLAVPDWTQFGRNIQQVMSGCHVLRHLAEKAATIGHLDHGERLSVLYALGHLNPNGHRAIHAIIGKCRNYDVAVTQHFIDRLSGLPIGCTRLRDKHATGDLLTACACDFGDVRQRGGYPTPLLHQGGFRRSWRDTLRGRANANPDPNTFLRTADEDADTPRQGQPGAAPASTSNAAPAQTSAAPTGLPTTATAAPPAPPTPPGAQSAPPSPSSPAATLAPPAATVAALPVAPATAGPQPATTPPAPRPSHPRHPLPAAPTLQPSITLDTVRQPEPARLRPHDWA